MKKLTIESTIQLVKTLIEEAGCPDLGFKLSESTVFETEKRYGTFGWRTKQSKVVAIELSGRIPDSIKEDGYFYDRIEAEALTEIAQWVRSKLATHQKPFAIKDLPATTTRKLESKLF